MERAKKVLVYALILLPLALGFKNLFDFSNPLAWGDAPYFYKENLIELFNFPFAWDIRNSNFGSGQLLTLWLFVPTFLQGFLYKLLSLNHEISVRIIFYFSYLLSASFGVYLLLSRFKFKPLAKTYGILFYLLNTYSILLIDGGQIGVLLSYGLFPLVIFTFVNLLGKKSLKNFLTAVVIHFLILNSDLRIAIIAIFFELIWWVFLIPEKKIKQIFVMTALWASIVLLSGFWVIPFLYGLEKVGGEKVFNNNQIVTSLTNSFYLFQPHFPKNDYGNLSKTPIYFIFVPFILFLSLLDKKREPLKLALIFLILVFLSKGETVPFPQVYSFITSLPLGNAFRDSSKFYIPSILTASILIGFSVEYIQQNFRKFKKFWLFAIYVFLLISIYPVFTGGLTGVLGKSPQRSEFNRIYQLVKSDNFFYRTLWFNERPSLGYADWNHPAVSANLLFLERPFASMIDGDYDLFGFLHNKYISEWYELLGIKYIFYPPYEREKSLTKKEKIERLQFEYFISKVPGLKKISTINDFPTYSTVNPLPEIFGQEKIVIALGGDDIYEKLLKVNGYNLENAGIIFLESGKFDPEILFRLNPNTYIFSFSRDINDLYMSFFSEYFNSPMLSVVREWAIEDSSRYLNWKAQLLERGIRNYDYDFGKGFAYSTKNGEKLKFDLNVKENKNYYLPIRYFTASQSTGLKVDFNNESFILKSNASDKLEWNLIGPLNLQKGNYSIIFTNTGDLSAFNTFGLIPENIIEQKKNQVEALVSSANKFYPDQISEIVKQLQDDVVLMDYKMINPTEYEIKSKKNVNWIVFSQRFDDNWFLKSDSGFGKPLPFYSIMNGFYAADIGGNSVLKLYYSKQDSVKIGILISICAFSLVCFAVIFYIIRNNEYIKKRFRNFKN